MFLSYKCQYISVFQSWTTNHVLLNIGLFINKKKKPTSSTKFLKKKKSPIEYRQQITTVLNTIFNSQRLQILDIIIIQSGSFTLIVSNGESKKRIY